MHNVVITLTEEDLLELQAALLDRDADAALAFLQTCLAPQVPARGTAPCDSTRRNPYLLKPDTGSC